MSPTNPKCLGAALINDQFRRLWFSLKLTLWAFFFCLIAILMVVVPQDKQIEDLQTRVEALEARQ